LEKLAAPSLQGTVDTPVLYCHLVPEKHMTGRYVGRHSTDSCPSVKVIMYRKIVLELK